MCCVGSLFKNGQRYTVQRHYKELHHYSFQDERAAKRARESQSDPEVCGKVKKMDKIMKSGFESKDDYIRNCVDLLTENNLSFEFFNSAPARRLPDPYDKFRNASGSGKTIRDHVEEMCANFSKRITQKLSDRLFSIKFDIVSGQAGAMRCSYCPARNLRWATQVRRTNRGDQNTRDCNPESNYQRST